MHMHTHTRPARCDVCLGAAKAALSHSQPVPSPAPDLGVHTCVCAQCGLVSSEKPRTCPWTPVSAGRPCDPGKQALPEA